MNPVEHHITVTRSARYYTLGEKNRSTQSIWVVIHGHRQLAKDFILNFTDFPEEGRYVIAPEGLMRLYIKGDYGDVGASWMTKEDREYDINDYVNYLDKLFDDIVKPFREKYKLNVNALGFSQGAATLSRWIALGKSKFDTAVFWCGNLAHDLDYSKALNFRSTFVKLFFADNDQYYDKDFYLTQEQLLSDAGIKFETKIFSGRHEISSNLLKKYTF